MLEALSQALWQKPYGEAKNTLFLSQSRSEKKGENRAGRVHILHYGQEVILVLDGEYITGSFPGTDLETPFKAIEAQAQSLAGAHDSFVRQVVLPEVLVDDYETDDIIRLSETLGHFRYDRPLIDCIEGADAIHVNGEHCPFGLDGDFEGDFSGSVEMNGFERSLQGHAVWHPEIDSQGDHYEFFFSLADLGRAVEINPGEWSVAESDSDNRCIVKLFYDQNS
jgi:hypothetical protein